MGRSKHGGMRWREEGEKDSRKVRGVNEGGMKTEEKKRQGKGEEMKKTKKRD